MPDVLLFVGRATVVLVVGATCFVAMLLVASDRIENNPGLPWICGVLTGLIMATLWGVLR